MVYKQINVMDYGAIGNGVANDTTAIQAAMNDCVSGVGNVLIFPAGTYRITAAITVTGGSHIYVEGQGSVIKGNRNDLFRVRDTSHFQVSNLTFDTPATTGVARFYRGIKTSYVTLSDCHMINGALAYFLSSYDGTPIDYNDKTFWNEHIRLERCSASGGFLVDNIVMIQKANHVVIEQCYFEKGTGDGIKFNGGDCENLYIMHNEICHMVDDGVDMYGSGRYLHINDNYFHDIRSYPANLKLSGEGVNTASAYKAWFINNRVENNALGLGLANGKSILVQGNIFKNNGIDSTTGTQYSHMILVSESAEDIRFIDNDFLDNKTRTGILSLEQVGEGMNLYCLIQGNRFRNNTPPALVAIGKSDSTANRMIDVEGNLFDGMTGRAIQVQINKGSVNIKNNRFINGPEAVRITTLSAIAEVVVSGNKSEVSGAPLVNSTSTPHIEHDNSWNYPYAGPTSKRPPYPYLGQVYFDTTVGRMMYCRSVTPRQWLPI
ncbi:right-handed parallel beta-helix repeat-containing protein [Brevibacillus sp. 179-C9.3 HS]|uniref:right-handed parallel beta-helix repeat-containing protein n=1 Tax=unclassified Brevibacillus TaxID=2684853 RepID=UPI0039A16089